MNSSFLQGTANAASRLRGSLLTSSRFFMISYPLITYTVLQGYILRILLSSQHAFSAHHRINENQQQTNFLRQKLQTVQRPQTFFAIRMCRQLVSSSVDASQERHHLQLRDRLVHLVLIDIFHLDLHECICLLLLSIFYVYGEDILLMDSSH